MKIIKFFTQECAPCKVMKHIIDKLISNHPEIEYEEVDCTYEVPNKWAQEIRSVPTIIIISDLGVDKKIVGARPYEFLEDELKTLC